MVKGISGPPSPLGCICGGTRQASQEVQARVRWCWLFPSHLKLWEAIYNQPQGSTTNRMHKQDEQTVLICSGVSSLRSIMLDGYTGKETHWTSRQPRRSPQGNYWLCKPTQLLEVSRELEKLVRQCFEVFRSMMVQTR